MHNPTGTTAQCADSATIVVSFAPPGNLPDQIWRVLSSQKDAAKRPATVAYSIDRRKGNDILVAVSARNNCFPNHAATKRLVGREKLVFSIIVRWHVAGMQQDKVGKGLATCRKPSCAIK